MNARIQWVVLLLLVSGLPVPASSGSHPRTFTLVSADAHGWTISYISSLQPANKVLIGGIPYSLYESAGDESAGPGAPALPVDVMNLGIPPGSQLRVELKNVVYETLDGQDVAPRPAFHVNGRNDVEASYAPDPGVYARDAWFPANQFSSGPSFQFRQQTLFPIRVSPLQYNPALRRIRRIVRATVVVSLSENTAQPLAAVQGGPDPLAEDAYKDLMVNYEQARQWRSRRAAALSGSAADSTGAWIDPAAPYVKIGILADGWYRISVSELQQIGVTPEFPTVRFYQRGREIPALLEGDSAAFFFGERNRGDSTYDDFFSDTGFVWMTWGGAEGMRYRAVSPPTSIAHVITWVNTTVHNEKNTDYYLGTGLDQVTNTFDVPGEGWVWEYYYPGTTIDHQCILDNIDTSDEKGAVVTARLYSTTSHSSTPDHVAQFTFNGTEIGQVSFNGRKGAWPSFTVGAPLLKTSNTLTIQSVPTATPVNQFYLDWFDVTYPRSLAATNDMLQFTADPAYAAPSARFRVAGFSSSDVIVVDRSLGRVLTADSTDLDPGGTYTVVFSDTVSVPRSYVVAARAGAWSPVSVQRKQFVNLRSLPGADYIVLTHPLFLSAATSLASERGATRGIRAQVVNVQDVYDEFNYGLISPVAIKRFLQYAYSSWPGPAPASVVILGDASWDPHHYMAATVNTDFVPAYGVPSGDNWYACFDSVRNFIPSMFIGRLPAMDSSQAQALVSKVIAYDQTQEGEWSKRFLFMTAGGDTAENLDFAARSDGLIGSYVEPAPLGAKAVRAYKTSPAIIDGSMKPMLMQTFNEGIVFVSFVGHSGGRIWGLDAGSPYDLQGPNTRLPFIASVSCNVGGFATPTGMVLSEDYVLADHRGAVAMWASASLGYPTYGTLLEGDFLGRIAGGERAFGSATTAARLLLWEQGGNNYITVAHQFLTPLLGDPLSRFALPPVPDLALQASDVGTEPSLPTTADTVVFVTVKIRNFGVVPPSGGTLSMTDTYNGQTSTVVDGFPFGRVFVVDSVTVPWRPGQRSGQHTLTLSISLPDSVQEVTRANNTLTFDRYVYTNSLQAVRPLDGTVVASGPVKLVVASQVGTPQGGFNYIFELDTVSTFASPFHIVSPPVPPKPVSGEWISPPVPAGVTVYWRARTTDGTTTGRWMNANFSTSSLPPALPKVRWEQHRGGQFAENTGLGVSSSDTGIVLHRSAATLVRCRSLGHLAFADSDYYSVIQVGLDVITGLWWEIGDSYMAVRVNSFDGTYVFRPFDLSNPVNADSMAAFIVNTPEGSYLGLVAMARGRSNVNEPLYSAIEGLGSQKIRLVQDGDAWAMIARKGYPGESIEGYSPDTVAIARSLPTYFTVGTGTVTTPLLPVPLRWDKFWWQTSADPGVSSIGGWMVGVLPSGLADTVKSLVGDSGAVDLSSIPGAGGPYTGFRLGARLSTLQSSTSPSLFSWSTEFVAPAELALQYVLAGEDLIVPRGTPVQIPLRIYNLGYTKTDSALVAVGAYDLQNNLKPLFSTGTGSIPVDSIRDLVVTVPTGGLPGRATLQFTVAPADSSGDLFPGNNSVVVAFTVTGPPQGTIDIYADGVGVMDGDYIAATPTILARPRLREAPLPGTLSAALVIDGSAAGPFVPLDAGGAAFHPTLASGRHQLRVVILERSSTGVVDTLARTLSLTVAEGVQLLQVYNYPDPFRQQTEFTFVLAGSRVPDGARIRVYTVAGRKIRDMSLWPGQVVVGFNRIPWDGRDEDGDTIANGIYFYQIEVSTGGKTASILGKMAKVR
jgi:hypothetical protein